MRCDFVIKYQKCERFKHYCIRCGYLTPWTTTECNPYRTCDRPGLGDRLQAIVELFTKRRPCPSCQRRKIWLNEFDRQLYRLIWGPKDGKTYP